MPFVSEKQRRFMYAAAMDKAAKSKYGISQEDAKSFISHSKDEPIKGKKK